MNLTKTFWEQAYTENAPKIIGVCRRYVQDKQVAEDLMHDVFLTAINKQSGYSGKGCFDAWLRKIAVNTALMYLRNKKARMIDDDLIRNEIEYQNMDEPNNYSIRTVIEQANFTDNDLLEIIDQLPEHHKLVFNLYVIDRFTHVQIAQELAISIGTSKSHLARARKKVQQLLYVKALDKPQEKKRKRAGLLLLIMPFREQYIDKLFNRQLSQFAIQPLTTSAKVFNLINWNTAAIPKLSLTLFNATVKYWLVAASCTSVVLLSIYGIRQHNKPAITQPINNITPSIADTTAQTNDTLALKLNPKVEINKPKPKRDIVDDKPIVVKRTIIQHKTIVIKDTVTK